MSKMAPMEERSLKVIQIGVYPQDINLIKGGVEASVFGIANALGRLKNVSVKIITFPRKSIIRDYHQEIRNNIQVAYIANPFKLELLSVLRVSKMMKEIGKFKPDYVHLHGTNPIMLFIILFLKAKRINFTITVHGILTIEHKKSFRRDRKIASLVKYFLYSSFEASIIYWSPKIICGTAYVKDWVSTKRSFYKQKFFIIPQGIDDRFYNVPDSYKENVLVSIGSISERKGYEYSVKAMRLLINERPDMLYYILGVSNDESYFLKLKKLIVNLNLQNSVFILDNTDTSIIESHLSEAYIFVLHSEEESQGIALSEAMAAGKPIVATNVGGIPYIVKNEVNGFLSPFKDVGLFAENIRRLLNSKNLREKISEENRKESLKYQWDFIANNILAVYKTI